MYKPDMRDFSRLDSTFGAKLQESIDACKSKYGITMVPYCNERSSFEQARLYRQSRSRAQINAYKSKLQNAGADYLAWCLDAVGPQPTRGSHVTWTMYSYHALGLATDLYWKSSSGSAIWSSKKGGANNGYVRLREEARARGLGHLRGDFPHIQSQMGSLLKMVSASEYSRLCHARYGETVS